MTEPTLLKCENPHCGRMVECLTEKKLDKEELLLLCGSCYSYARRCGILRPAKLVEKAAKVRMTLSGVRICSNPNCQTHCVDGFFAKDNEKLYCNACVRYRDAHHTDRPKSLIESSERLKLSGHTWGKCENPNCQELVQLRVQWKSENEGWMQMCRSCYCYATKRGSLRSAEMVKRARMLRKRHESRPTHCFNKNCQTTDLEGAQYGTHNNQLYCNTCGRYVNRHRGEERPRALVEASRVRHRKCANPNCDIVTRRLLRAEVEGGGVLRLCRACKDYAKKTKKLRPAEMIERAKMAKRRKLGGEKCHNGNCQTTELTRGGYAKCNGEYYCEACCRYINLHDGTEQPRKLVDEERLRKSRYMWQQKHPKLKR